MSERTTATVVISTETFEHVLDPQRFVDALRGVARGWVVVTTPVEGGDPPDWGLDETATSTVSISGLQGLFGARATATSYRANVTYGLYAAVGRWLGSAPKPPDPPTPASFLQRRGPLADRG